jgi:membrane-associated protease RseP (regulator of RpoE activity)
MRLNSTLVAIVVALAAGPALGQSLLDKFESKLKAPGPAAPGAAAPGTAAPGTATPGTATPGTVAPGTVAPGAPGAGAGAAAAPAPGYLGAQVDDTPDLNKGVLVTGVKKGAPSEVGGLRAGDIIVEIDGKPCRNLDDLDAILAKGTVGTKLTMKVQRLGKVETKVITLGRKPIEADPVEASPATDRLSPPPGLRPAPPTLAPAADPLASPLEDPAGRPPTLRPATDPLATPADPLNPVADPLANPLGDPALTLPAPPGGDKPAADPFAPPTPDPSLAESPAPAASGKASLGIQVVPLNDETRAQYDIRSTARQGAVIVSVRPGSPADSVGLPIGGVVVAIDGKLVKSSDELVDFISAARPGQEVELRYYQGDSVVTKSVKLAPAAARGVVTAPPRPGMALRNPERPLLRKFEDMVESLGPNTPPPPTAGSSIFDPSRLAELHNDVKAMSEKLDALEKRVKQLEEKAGANP